MAEAKNMDTSETGYIRGLSDANPVSAAFIAAGIGVLVMAVLQFAGESNEAFNESLAFSESLGPYSGKYVISYAAWLLSWAVLYPIARKGVIPLRVAIVVAVVLIVVAGILLFPPFIQIFVGG